jgi:prephenate dehydrogenase
MGAVFASIKDSLGIDTVVTDAGSAKASVVEAVKAASGEIPAWFVPGHPIAGTEQSGVEASFPDLYKGRRVILTPTAETSAAAVQRVRAMWEAVGAVVNEMPVEHHDEVLAATSHLPHMLAFALVESLARMSEQREIFEYAAGGFRDFTRIASLAAAIEDRDERKILSIFQDAKAARDDFDG